MSGLILGARRRVSVVAALVPLAVAATIMGSTDVRPAQAQETQLRSLLDRVDRLQRELVTLQRHVYRDEVPTSPQQSGPPGPLGVGGDLSPTQAARINVKLSQFEGELRNLIGRVEEVSYRLEQTSSRLDRLVADVDLRLQRLESGGAPLAETQEQPGMPNAVREQTGSATAGEDRPSRGAATPGVLGTITSSEFEEFRGRQAAQDSAQTAAVPQTGGGAGAAGTAEREYQEAFGLLRQANYAEAERALDEFVERHPDHALAGNASYWLGETYYVRGDYRRAAVVFAEAYQKYPNNPKAPDNLLKLGMALAQLGSEKDACGTFGELIERYPDAADNILQRARGELQRMEC